MVSKQYLPIVKYRTTSQLLFIINTYKYKKTICPWIVGVLNKCMSERQSLCYKFYTWPSEIDLVKFRHYNYLNAQARGEEQELELLPGTSMYSVKLIKIIQRFRCSLRESMIY